MNDGDKRWSWLNGVGHNNVVRLGWVGLVVVWDMEGGKCRRNKGGSCRGGVGRSWCLRFGLKRVRVWGIYLLFGFFCLDSVLFF